MVTRARLTTACSGLAHDESQVEYYENVTKNMVGRVLSNHVIVGEEGKTECGKTFCSAQKLSRSWCS